MNTRKKIALITASPDEIYQQEIMKGVFSRCSEYGYDVAVITPLITLSHFYDIYLRGEINIYNLFNPDLFDGIIITSLAFAHQKNHFVFENIIRKLREKNYTNIVLLDQKIDGFKSSFTDDRPAVKEIAAHIYDYHGCSDVYFLSGPENGDSSERLEGYREFLRERGLECDESRIFYGDFWFPSGEKLADDIYSGKVHKPEAVICASDHMAIGLINRLTSHGIKVPEEIIVTGFDSTAEGALNDISVTSYNPKLSENAVHAVDMLHSMIEGNNAVTLPVKTEHHGLVFGDSCNCINSDYYFRKTFRSNIMTRGFNYGEESIDKPYDIGVLIDCYISEQLIRSQDEKQCLIDIISAAYLMRPFETFSICLRRDWISSSESFSEKYPDKMILAVRKCLYDEANSKYGIYNPDAESFDTSLMLPEMHEEHDEPRVYYYLPVHFDDFTFGYAVLVRKLDCPYIMNNVTKQWLRYVNTALEMTRNRTKIFNNTITDVTTGLFNRHGMYSTVSELQKNIAKENEYLISQKLQPKKFSIIVIMIDMDGLKRINDTYGHKEGDFGINLISESLKQNSEIKDLAVRNGGDEFLFICYGEYSENDAEKLAEEKINAIERCISEKSSSSGKPFSISASLGYSVSVLDEKLNLDELISIADAEMYENKKRKKAERKD